MAADAGNIDVAMLRRSWPQLIDHLANNRQMILKAILESATVASYVVPPEHTLVGGWWKAHVDGRPGTIYGETTLFAGWIALGLGAIGLRIARACRAFDIPVIGVRRSAGQPDDPVDAVFPPSQLDELLPRAMETAFQLAAKSPLALEAAKEAINRALGGDHAENLEHEGDRFGELFGSEDAKEGLTAFIEKREPAFRGR